MPGTDYNWYTAEDETVHIQEPDEVKKCWSPGFTEDPRKICGDISGA